MNDGIQFAELLAYNEQETARWKEWFRAHPDALKVPCDIAQAKNVADLLFHVFAVELNFSHIVNGLPRPDFKALPRETLDELFAVSETAAATIRQFLERATAEQWTEVISLGFRDIKATRRKMLAQAFLHSVHHRGQLAAFLRQQGYADGWIHDILMSDVLD